MCESAKQYCVAKSICGRREDFRRFDRVVWMRPPDLPGRAAILRHHLASLRLAETMDRDAVIAAMAAQTEGTSGADLAFLCQAAARRCVQDAVQRDVPADAVVITASHLQQSLQIWLDEHAALRQARSVAPHGPTAPA
jgi:SpoVK/Ycf46/Vps4 family AAA+-type ATPase